MVGIVGDAGIVGDIDDDSTTAFFVLYAVFDWLLAPIMGYSLYNDLKLLEQTKNDGVDAMEGGGYALYNEESKVTVGAAACGFSVIYRYVCSVLCYNEVVHVSFDCDLSKLPC